MAGIGLSFDPTHIRGLGIANWYIKLGSDAARYSLGRLTESDIDVKDVPQLDSQGRNRPKKYALAVKARSLNTHDLRTGTTGYYAGLLECLSTLGRGLCDHRVVDMNGQSFGGPWGVACKFHVDNNERYMEVMGDYEGPLDNNAVAAIYGIDETMATPAADGTPNALDTLYVLNALTDLQPAPGIYKHEISFDSGSTYESIGPIRNGVMDIEQIVTKDDLGRSFLVNLKASIDIESDATSTERALLDSATTPMHRVTLMDGVQFVFGVNVGISWNWQAKGDADKGAQLIKFKGSGVIRLADWWASSGSPILKSALT